MEQAAYNVILEKLTFQVKSLQEGFNILAISANMNEFGKSFSHILRGSLLIADVNLFYKTDSAADWQETHVYNKISVQYLSVLKTDEEISFETADDFPFSAAVTLPLSDGAYFGLILGNKFDKTGLTEIDKITLQMFIQLLDNAYQAFMQNRKEKQLNFSLNHRVLQLNSLIDTGIDISKSNNTDELLELALERAVALTNASMGIIEVKAGVETVTVIGFPDASVAEMMEDSQYKINTVVEFKEQLFAFTLAEKETREGVIDFDDTDKMLIEAIARQVIAAIETEHFHKESIVKERMQHEMKTASEIQKKIIPQSIPVIEGYDLAGINIPSLEVGGDYFDVIKLNNGKYILIIADVSGKGVASGLLVNTLNATLNAYIENDFVLTDISFRLNKIIYKASTPEKYITCFIALLDPVTGELEYVNAGHNPILLYKDNTLQKLEKGGVAFGMFDFGIPYENGIVNLVQGDRVLLYTDGVTEAMDKDENEYSDERLEQFFTNNSAANADSFMKELVADVRLHSGDTPQSDDITAVYLIKK